MIFSFDIVYYIYGMICSFCQLYVSYVAVVLSFVL